MLYAVAKLSAPGTQSFSHFLSRVKCRDAMDRNKIDTLFLCILLYLLLVWAVTSEQMNIKAEFFFQGTWYHELILVIWDTIISVYLCKKVYV